MADLLDLLRGQLSENSMESLSRHTGINDTQKTAKATNAILAFLTGAMAKNSSTKSGASALLGALDRDHDGSVLDDVGGLLTNALGGGYGSKTMNGIGILGHLLGARQNFVVEAIARMTGLHKNQTAMLMVRLAPLALGMLGKMRKKNEISNESGLQDILNNTINNRRPVKEQSIIEKILDRDGDGSVMDEVASMGMKALGGFLFK